MKLIQKITAIILALTIMLPLCSFVATAADTAEEISVEMQLLQKIGVVLPEDYEKPLTGTMTRAEFAMTIIKLHGMETVAASLYHAGYFKDVEADYEETGYINAAASVGLMKPVAEGYFEPKTPVTGDDVVYAFAKLLGYGAVVDESETPYLTAVQVLNRSDMSGVSQGSSNPTRAQIFSLFEQAISAPVLVVEAIGSFEGEDYGTYATGKELTVLSEYHDIYSAKGIVTANERTSLESAEGALGNDKVQIGGTVYNDPDGAAKDYLGYRVTYYWQAGTSGESGNVIFAWPYQTETVTLLPADIIRAAQMQLVYIDEDGKTETADLRGAYILYNGAAVLEGINFMPESGEVILIDNDGDGEYEVASILSYTEVIFAALSSKSDVVYGEFSQKIDLGDIENVTVTDVDNNRTIPLVSLEAGMIVSGYASYDGDSAELYATKEAFTGTATMLTSDDGIIVEIDGESYRLSQALERHISGGSLDAIKPGLNYTWYYNHTGEIAYYVRNRDVFTDYEFAYLLAGKQQPGLDQRVLLRYYSQFGMEAEGALADTVYIDEAKITDANTAYGLLCKNGENGVRGSEVVPQLIRIKTNQEGQITYIDMAADAPNGQDSLYITHDAAVDGALRYQSQARGFVDATTYEPTHAMTTTVPTFAVDAGSATAVTANTEVSYTVASNSFISGSSYDDFVLYAVNEEKINPACIVRYAAAATSFATTDAFCLCLNVVTGVDNNGDVKKKIVYSTDGSEKSVFVSEDIDLERLTYQDSTGTTQTYKLMPGDVFRFLSNVAGDAVAIELIYSMEQNELLFPGHTTDTEYRKQLYPGHPTYVSGLLIGGVLSHDGEYMRFAYDNPESPTATGMSYMSTLFASTGRALLYSKEKGTVRKLSSADEILDYKTVGSNCSKGVLIVRTITPMFLFLYED